MFFRIGLILLALQQIYPQELFCQVGLAIYKSDHGGFSISIPKSWQKREYDSDHGIWVFEAISTQEQIKDPFAENLNITMFPPDTRNLTEANNSSIELLKQNLPDLLFIYILTKKGINRASSDVGLMFIAYNLRRIGNILTMNVLKEYLRILVSVFLSKLHISELKSSSFGSWFIQFLGLNRKFMDSLIPA